MKENVVYSLVFIAVLVTAGLGLYFMFTFQPAEYGLTVEGVKALGLVRRPYAAWEETAWDLQDKILGIPAFELPYAERTGSVCLVAVNVQTLAIAGYPVPRSIRTIEAIQELENRGYRVLKTIPSSTERICPHPNELPPLDELLVERGVL